MSKSTLFQRQFRLRIEEAKESDDTDMLAELFTECYRPAKVIEEPFQAPIEPKPSFAKNLSGGVNEARSWLRQLAEARGQLDYRHTCDRSDQAKRVIALGDGWFLQPTEGFPSILKYVRHSEGVAILPFDVSGHSLSTVVEQEEYFKAIREQQAELLVLSLGGSDLFEQRALGRLLNPYEQGHEVGALVENDALEEHVGSILQTYRKIVLKALEANANLRIFGQGYDVPHPNKRGKDWFGKSFKSKGIPPHLNRELVRYLLHAFNEKLNLLEAEEPAFTHIDLRGVVDRGPNSWESEFYPKKAGFERAADVISERMSNLESTSPTEVKSQTVTERISNQKTNNQNQPSTHTPGMATIVLDPGHGGTSNIGGSSWNNAVGPAGTLEKNVTLDVAVRARDQLQARGHNVTLTRDTDANLGLADRANVARQLQAPVFVSIHFNGFPTPVQGTETFCHTTHRPISADLCRAVQRHVVQATGHNDRNQGHPGGVKRASFGVLRQSRHHHQTACVLLEVSFMDMADEEQRLQQASYKNSIASAIADGIEDYLGVLGSGSMAAGFDPDELEDGFQVASMGGSGGSLYIPGATGASTGTAYGGHALASEESEDGYDAAALQQVQPEIEECDIAGIQGGGHAAAQVELEYSNQNAIRNQPCTANIEQKLVQAVGAVYGSNHKVSIYSGGQDRLGQGTRRTGSVRHDNFGNGGRAADVYVYDASGNKIQALELAKLGQYWLASGFGGVGHEMAIGGIHLDEWTTPPSGGGMFWTYSYSQGKPWGAEARQMLVRGSQGVFPDLHGS